MADSKFPDGQSKQRHQEGHHHHHQDADAGQGGPKPEGGEESRGPRIKRTPTRTPVALKKRLQVQPFGFRLPYALHLGVQATLHTSL